ncbi:MAG: oligosaccharide flippase family protein [Bacteroides sp.]|nr:oligosaccharide flippase family protein [Bacteroides sp.]MCM1379656.1 oligosaccharide flippase family protein [Bacteroides sp.]MCM1445962.1 oligosaccharide flippase family protein [Prevotella sp.]
MAKALTQRVVKSITLLGSTQGLNMVCSVVRMKILAILVGPAGVGLMGALTQAGDLIAGVSQLNIRTSAVPKLASAPPETFNSILISVRRYSRVLGCIGMLLMFLLAPWLSTFTFGSAAYAWAYRIVSFSLLFQALQGSELIVLQATGRYKPIATNGLITAVCGLALAVVFYWFLRADGIAPSIVGYALFAWLGAMWFTRHHRITGAKPSWGQSLKVGSGFIAVGVLLTVTSFTTEGVNFLFLAIVRRLSGSDTLGVYQSGYTLVWRYTAIFFTAFSMEFYPRLIKVINRRRHSSLLISHQAIVSTWMMTPCSAAIAILAPWLIPLLFSSDFFAALPYVMWGMVAMTIRPLSITMSYSFLAAGRNKMYALTEILSALTGLVINTVGYYFGGFAGLGLAAVAWMTIDVCIMLTAARLSNSPMPSRRACLTTVAAALLLVTLNLFAGQVVKML